LQRDSARSKTACSLALEHPPVVPSHKSIADCIGAFNDGLLEEVGQDRLRGILERGRVQHATDACGVHRAVQGRLVSHRLAGELSRPVSVKRNCGSGPAMFVEAAAAIIRRGLHGKLPSLSSARTTSRRTCSAAARGTHMDCHLLALGSPLGLYAELSNP
jgi:hypothetical protein